MEQAACLLHFMYSKIYGVGVSTYNGVGDGVGDGVAVGAAVGTGVAVSGANVEGVSVTTGVGVTST